jgi:hypothetical protein
MGRSWAEAKASMRLCPHASRVDRISNSEHQTSASNCCLLQRCLLPSLTSEVRALFVKVSVYERLNSPRHLCTLSHLNSNGDSYSACAQGYSPDIEFRPSGIDLGPIRGAQFLAHGLVPWLYLSETNKNSNSARAEHPFLVLYRTILVQKIMVTV